MYSPFIVDASPIACLIRAIDGTKRSLQKLLELQSLMTKDIDQMPYHYLEQCLRRTERTLQSTTDEKERDALDAIHRMALWRIQRIHIEARP